MTKKHQAMVNQYKDSLNRYGQRTELAQVYGKFSQAKQNGLDYCKQLEKKLNGHDGTIVSHNCFQFTYAFEYEDAETGVCMMCYCTASNDYKFEL